MLKFGLEIKTKDGLLVENLTVHANDETHAASKIRKVYRNCEIVLCKALDKHAEEDKASLDGIISLISKQGNDSK